MTKYRLSIIVILLMIFVVSGCRSSEDGVKDKIRRMQSQTVEIPFNKFSCWINDSLQTICPWENADMKLVVYIDSTQCSKCSLKQMYLWDDFVKLENKYKDRFEIFFIMHTNSVNVQSLASLFHLTQLNHPMYIDCMGAFEKKNPHIPSEQMYHTFLLDEKNNVILVGNPLFNPKVEEMLLTILKEKLGKARG